MTEINAIRSAILDAAGTCVAQEIFPFCPIPSFSVVQTENGYETDFAIATEGVFEMPRDEIAKAICENVIYCGDVQIKNAEVENGIIKIVL